ncbi:transcriptional regulator NrdR [Halogeometricum sp. S1BR25-6]|uniref:Transcriptional repressor NrdR n=1 Tax=Halogeometricum salsisoli TaxID=2950536 RepID=A0ABU2GKM7_9EURY|nr:transcriptional regulator NrdR [Halogeometricum sp. S1BR25-6]MDS0300844.1 transcriptional regulator NrdR [Halogeometricum sp. S1BR25-6]
MDCPDCGHDRTSVVDTRTGEDGATVRRRRECQRCSFRFTTYERPEWETLQVKKRDGRIEPFDRGKLRAGVERAVEKRPVDAATVESLVEAVERELAGRGTRIVSSSLVGELASDRLRDLDSVAYIRFVSVYEAFSDPEEFLDELDRVLDDRFERSDGSDDPDATTDDDSPDGTHTDDADD